MDVSALASYPILQSGTYSIVQILDGIASDRIERWFDAPADAVATATITVLPKPVTFTFGEREFDYDGTVKTVTVTPSDPAATWRVAGGALSGTDPGNLPFQVEAFGNYTGSAEGALVIRGTEVEVTAFSPEAAEYTVTEGPAAGHTYARSWQDAGVWCAYLARDGVRFRVAGRAAQAGIAEFEIQARPPGKEWLTLATGAPSVGDPNGPRTTVSRRFAVTLDKGRPDKPVIPADPSLAGIWTVRARARAASGRWSNWAFEQPLTVLLPLKSLSMTGRTLPPVHDADWFQASPSKQYDFTVWLP